MQHKPKAGPTLHSVVVLTVALCSVSAAAAVAGCSCPKQYKPVCGKDGKTYSSACEANCVNVVVVHSNECSTIGAASSRKPVTPTGTTGHTAQVESAQLRRLQQLQGLDGRNSNCSCPATYTPVCTEKGITRSNACLADCFFLEKVVYVGECNPNGAKGVQQKPASSAASVTRRGGGLMLMMGFLGLVMLLVNFCV